MDAIAAMFWHCSPKSYIDTEQYKQVLIDQSGGDRLDAYDTVSDLIRLLETIEEDLTKR